LSPLKSRRWVWIGIVAVVAIVIGVCWWCFRSNTSFNKPYEPAPISFSGTSDQLKQTVIVPTLDTPIPEGKSAIWCSSFQLAWNRLKDDVAKEPVHLANAQTIADRLNRADQSENDLNPDSVYAAAGLAKDGIVKRIHEQMARKFPNVPRPELDVPSVGAVAYAYLEASARYDYPFFENDAPLLFTDSDGKQAPVSSFGIRKKDDYAYSRMRQQVQVLYCPRESIGTENEVTEFIVDPCKTSKPNQIVVAQVSRKATLADTLADVEQKIAAQSEPGAFASQLHPCDTLLIPNIALRIDHRFKELEGKDKQFLNPALQGLHLDTASQTIQFRLDRSGADMAAEAKVHVRPSASFFHVNRPFLVYMKKRDGKHPFFVAWIENAELLERK
jgi:hypothetical protein